MKRVYLFILIIGCSLIWDATAFVLPGNKRTFTRIHSEEEKTNKVLDFMMNPYESKIPKEMEAEIYRAEGNTPAAQERTKRVASYGIVAIFLVGCAFFNAFLTELRHSDVMDGTVASMSLEELGFGWVQANILFRFVFLNKIGGGLALVSGALTGMLAEAELDSRRRNAERIWEELERRRSEGGPAKMKQKTKVAESRKKKQSGKQAKRLGALSEVVMDDALKPMIEQQQQQQQQPQAEPEKKQEGIMDKLKEWYDKADSMAASQALLLNKKLEEEGIVEKITDETGLKVIGKEAAAQVVESRGKDVETEQVKSKETTIEKNIHDSQAKKK